MTGFIDPASEHATALVNFHHYATFFLILVIVFVVWLLKLILQFIVFEKKLPELPRPATYIDQIINSVDLSFFKFSKFNTFFILILDSLPAAFLPHFIQFIMDIRHIYLSFSKGREGFATSREATLFLNEGRGDFFIPRSGIDRFGVLPKLFDGRYQFKRELTSSNLFSFYSKLRGGLVSDLLFFFAYVSRYNKWGSTTVDRYALWCVFFLSHKSRVKWVPAVLKVLKRGSVGMVAPRLLYLFAYKSSLKRTTWGELFGGRLGQFGSRDLVFNPHTLKLMYGRSKFSVLDMSPAKLVGHAKLSRRFARQLGVSYWDLKFFSRVNNNWFEFAYFRFFKFYVMELRMFFYLFFQNVRHRKVLEWVWTGVPAFILLLLLYPSLALLYCYDRPYITRPYLTFKAIGHQWYWSYEYSDYVANTEGVLEHIKFDSYLIHESDLPFGRFRLLEVDRRVVLPVGFCLRLVALSADVLHSWAVPALGVKIDAVPGRLNQFWVVIDRPGVFYGQCSELCGVNHGFMPIVIEGVDVDAFFDYLGKLFANF